MSDTESQWQQKWLDQGRIRTISGDWTIAEDVPVPMPSANWDDNTRPKPYTEDGSKVLDKYGSAAVAAKAAAKAAARAAQDTAQKQSEPYKKVDLSVDDIFDPVYWKTDDGTLMQGTYYMKRLGNNDKIPDGKTVEKPGFRTEHCAFITNQDGIGQTEIDDTTTFVTNMGNFTMGMKVEEVEDVQSVPSGSLYTSTSYMTNYNPAFAGGMKCTRQSHYRPPPRNELLFDLGVSRSLLQHSEVEGRPDQDKHPTTTPRSNLRGSEGQDLRRGKRSVSHSKTKWINPVPKTKMCPVCHDSKCPGCPYNEVWA